MEVDRNIAQSIVISTSVPDRKELCCVVTRIDPEDAEDSPAINSHDYRIEQCRLLIYRMPEIIASPIHDTGGDVCIIMNEEFYESGELQKELTLRNLKVVRYTYLMNEEFYESGELQKELTLRNLKISDPQKVTLAVYETCLRFTILYRLTSCWSPVAQYLLPRKFIASTEIIPAIQMDLTVYDQKLHFELWPSRVKLPFVKLEDLHLSEDTIAEFVADPNGYIDMTTFGSTVYVLPSLEKGKIIGISKKILETYPFQNYQSFRIHWKNVYGYHLPKSEEGIIYYHIRLLGKNCSIYPSVCVTSSCLMFVRCADHEAITDHFLIALKKAVPTICSRPVQLSLEKIFGKSKVENESPQCIAPSTSEIFRKSKVSVKTLQNNASIQSTENSLSGYQMNLLKRNISSSEICNAHFSGIISNTIPATSSLMGDAIRPSEISDKILSENIQIDDLNQLSDSEKTPNSNTYRRIRPEGNTVADPWTTVSNHSQGNDPDQTGNDRPLDPIQLAKNENLFKSSFLNGINNLPKRDKELRLNSFTELAQANKTPTKMEEDYVDDFPLFVSLTELNSQDEDDSEYKMEVKNIRFKNPSQLVSPPTFFQHTRASVNDEESSKNGMKWNPTKVYENSRQKIASKIESVAENTITPVAVQQNKEYIGKFFKTKRSLRINHSAFKKPIENKRKKIANVQDVNIGQMARHNNLKNVNVATLRHWLAEHSVPCKTREKKKELIAKVFNYIHQNRKLKNSEINK